MQFSKTKRIALGVAAAVAALVAGAALVIPIVVNVDRYRPQVIAQIEKETGKPVEIGRLTLTVLPRLAIRVDDFALGNPGGFPHADCIRAKKIYATVSVVELLHHKVDITALKFYALTVDMLEDTQGVWNFENSSLSSEASSSAPADSSAPAFRLGIISKLTVVDGNFSAASLLASGDRGPKLIDVHGATIDLRDVNLDAMNVNAPGTPNSPVAEGTIKVSAVALGPLNVSDLKSKIRLYPKQTFFDGLNLHCYGGSAGGNFSLNFSGDSLAYTADMTLTGVKIEQLLEPFPKTSGQLTGTLEGAARMQGLVLKSDDPLEAVTGSGRATIRDGKMPSLQVAGNLRSLAQFANLGATGGDPSAFNSLSADFRIADGRLSSDKIDLEGNGLNVTGSGSLTMAGEGTLEYQANASLALAGSNPLTAVLGGLAGGRISDDKLTIPFALSGTFAKPRFSLQSGAGNDQGTSSSNGGKNAQLVRGLASLFKKKKQD